MAEALVATPHPFFTYTSEILAWRLGEPAAQPEATYPGDVRTAARVARIMRASATRRGVILLGLGTGELAAALADALPPDTPLAVCSLAPPTARRLVDAGALGWREPDGTRQLLADTSAQALFCLLALATRSAGTDLVTVNPETPGPQERPRLSFLRRLLTESAPAAQSGTQAQPLTLAVMARATEPDLPGFFAAAAGLASRAVIVWDGDAVPEAAGHAALLDAPVVHLARRLDRDFAAQRNTLLAACPPGWILGLDPDERPGPGFRQALDRIMATPGLGGAYFPRMTLFPDETRFKAGYGLWPDLQLRLFANIPPSRPRYIRPIHERLEGLTGRMALALDAPILHYNRLLTDDAAVASKLDAFSAVPGAPVHHLSRAYPTLPRDFFDSLCPEMAPPRILLLPAGSSEQ